MIASSAGRLRVLHCLSRGGEGGHPAPDGQVAASLGDAAHFIALPAGEAAAARQLLPGLDARLAGGMPSLAGWPGPGRLVAIARALAPFDLVLTYGGQGLNAAMARRVFARSMALPPLVHHELPEAGAGAQRLSLAARMQRSIALGGADALIVETSAMARRASQEWHVPDGRVHVIARGIDCAPFASKVARDALPGLIKRESESWIGAVAYEGLESEVYVLLDALARLPTHWQLVLECASGIPEALRSRAEALELSHRVHFHTPPGDRARTLGLCDIYVELASGEGFALTTLQAMAAGLPVVARAGAPAAEILSPQNRKLLDAGAGVEDFARAVLQLADDALACREMGKANRARARSEFAREAMVARYGEVYAAALGKGE